MIICCACQQVRILTTRHVCCTPSRSGSRPRKRCGRCSRMCRRRWPIPWRFSTRWRCTALTMRRLCRSSPFLRNSVRKRNTGKESLPRSCSRSLPVMRTGRTRCQKRRGRRKSRNWVVLTSYTVLSSKPTIWRSWPTTEQRYVMESCRRRWTTVSALSCIS